MQIYENYTVCDLRKILKSRGLVQFGKNKAVLVARLKAYDDAQ